MRVYVCIRESIVALMRGLSGASCGQSGMIMGLCIYRPSLDRLIRYITEANDLDENHNECFPLVNPFSPVDYLSIIVFLYLVKGIYYGRYIVYILE